MPHVAIALLGAIVAIAFVARKRRVIANHAKDEIPIDSAFAKAIGTKLGVDWGRVDAEQFRRGLEVEQEHFAVTGLDFSKIAQIALDHLENEGDRRDYYDALDRLERGGC